MRTRGAHFIMTMQLKPPRSFTEQLEILKSRGLLFRDEEKALEILKTNSYYRLTGYMLEFHDAYDNFHPNVFFEDIFNAYLVDEEIRVLLIRLINEVEVNLRTKLASYHTIKYGSEGYINPNTFNNLDVHTKLMVNLMKAKADNKLNLVMKKHNEKYGGHLPLWVLIEWLSFGTVSRVYSNLKNYDKKEFIDLYYKNVSAETVKGLYLGISQFRNMCCHYNRLYRVWHKIKSPNYKIDGYKIERPIGLRSDIAINSLTFYFVYISFLLNPNKNLGNDVIYAVENIRQKYNVDLNFYYGFPKNWGEILNVANGYCIKE